MAKLYPGNGSRICGKLVCATSQAAVLVQSRDDAGYDDNDAHSNSDDLQVEEVVQTARRLCRQVSDPIDCSSLRSGSTASASHTALKSCFRTWQRSHSLSIDVPQCRPNITSSADLRACCNHSRNTYTILKACCFECFDQRHYDC